MLAPRAMTPENRRLQWMEILGELGAICHVGAGADISYTIVKEFGEEIWHEE
jgi:hypothetical protein